MWHFLESKIPASKHNVILLLNPWSLQMYCQLFHSEGISPLHLWSPSQIQPQSHTGPTTSPFNFGLHQVFSLCEISFALLLSECTLLRTACFPNHSSFGQCTSVCVPPLPVISSHPDRAQPFSVKLAFLPYTFQFSWQPWHPVPRGYPLPPGDLLPHCYDSTTPSCYHLAASLHVGRSTWLCPRAQQHLPFHPAAA